MKIYERCVLFMSDKNDKLDRVRVTFTISKEVADYYRELSKRFSVPYSTLMAMHLSQKYEAEKLLQKQSSLNETLLELKNEYKKEDVDKMYDMVQDMINLVKPKEKSDS